MGVREKEKNGGGGKLNYCSVCHRRAVVVRFRLLCCAHTPSLSPFSSLCSVRALLFQRPRHSTLYTVYKTKLIKFLVPRRPVRKKKRDGIDLGIFVSWASVGGGGGDRAGPPPVQLQLKPPDREREIFTLPYTVLHKCNKARRASERRALLLDCWLRVEMICISLPLLSFFVCMRTRSRSVVRCEFGGG